LDEGDHCGGFNGCDVIVFLAFSKPDSLPVVNFYGQNAYKYLNVIRRVIENDSSYSLFEYLKPLMHLRYSKPFQGEDASASSSLGIM
jgi:hypothetical protein